MSGLSGTVVAEKLPTAPVPAPRRGSFLPPFRWIFPATTLGLILFIILPPITLLSLSVNDRFDLVWGIFPAGVSFDLYRESGPAILRSVAHSMRIAVPTVILSFLVGLPVAYALVRLRFPGRGLLAELVNLPLVFPPIVLAFGLMQMFKQGPFAGVSPWVAIVLGHTIVSLPFMIQPIIAALQRVDIAVEDAARSLGASPLRAFLTTVLPIIVPSVLTGVALVFARSISDFEITLLLTTPEISTMPIAIYQAFESGSTRLGAAVAMATNLFAVGVIVILEVAVRRVRWW
ncbi:ABC transporter permease [Roseomonas aerophila]|uniref:ABC transporter permease n=1 Tax=Teichococcus aerophilus TaxID=1224513 RepID=A0ABR7RQC5_9PROT|nr:ABC transporter permease [Pseudoroseomonas aerophila]